ncbi:MAG: hypothetical protein IKX68_06450 [Clostridiales bacterium]|nr:hypothetical protein [Clostridiales bacterium]
MINRKHIKTFSFITAAALMMSVASCSKSNSGTEASSASSEKATVSDKSSREVSGSDDIEISKEISNDEDGAHAIEADGETSEYSHLKVTKTGDSDSGDEADFYGDNSAIFATNGAILTLSDIVVDTDGTHANAVFSYGDGTTVNISNSVITTTGNCSGGLMTTGGGTMNATDLTIHTTGNSSAAIRSDRGGGTVNVDGGSYTTDGKGSPVIYSTADITVSNAVMESTSSQGVVVEGKNSVTLNNVELIADNNTKNSDKSEYYQAVMIYQSMSGDAAEGLATFNMTGGSLTNANGDVFFVNNTATTITLEDVQIVNRDADGVFLRAAAAGWGSSGANGGKVNLYLKDQDLIGDMIVDDISTLNMYLSSGTTYSGAINADNSEGQIYVEIESGSKWVLTEDSYITSLTCDADGIELNGHTLYVNGVEYTQGTTSSGEAIEIISESSGRSGSPDGMPGDPPSGSPDGKPGDPPSGERPEGDPPKGGPDKK